MHANISYYGLMAILQTTKQCNTQKNGQIIFTSAFPNDTPPPNPRPDNVFLETRGGRCVSVAFFIFPLFKRSKNCLLYLGSGYLTISMTELAFHPPFGTIRAELVTYKNVYRYTSLK